MHEVTDAVCSTIGLLILEMYGDIKQIKEMENQMKAAAKELEFERAAMLRDQVYELKAILVENSKLPPWKKQALLAQDLGD